jgi:hypothetical protein
MYDEYDYIDHDERICLSCSVAGCDCDEFISGCESEQDDKQAYVEKTYEAYRALLDRVPRVYDDALARARKAYTDASALL